jgi:hypothetical protein
LSVTEKGSSGKLQIFVFQKRPSIRVLGEREIIIIIDYLPRDQTITFVKSNEEWKRRRLFDIFFVN